MLQYNKLYQSLKKVGGEWHAGHFQWYYYWNYIKFFEDGTLIESSINSDDSDKIQLNFMPDNQNISHGKYTYDGKELIIELNNVTLKGGETLEGNIVIQSLANLNWDKYFLIN
jgi:hypothetical protein